jgi:3-deoxy-D-manno-octulosonate 8-phosphate phosphatase (KDO 8-P phosphatase)
VLDAALARRIKLVALDVDGVLTDGGIYLGMVAHQSLEFKRFHVQDGLAVKLLRAAGLSVLLVSGRASEATEARAQEMEVDELLQVAPREKLAALVKALECRGIQLEECVYVGDDLADLPVLRAVGLGISVPNAAAEVRAAAAMVTSVPGGEGAVRQVAEMLLKARGEWPAILARYTADDVADPRHGSR